MIEITEEVQSDHWQCPDWTIGELVGPRHLWKPAALPWACQRADGNEGTTAADGNEGGNSHMQSRGLTTRLGTAVC